MPAAHPPTRFWPQRLISSTQPGVVDDTLSSTTCSKGNGLVQFCRRRRPSQKLALGSWDGQNATLPWLPRGAWALPGNPSFARRLATPLIAALGPRPRAKSSDDLANRLHLFCSLTGLEGWGPLFFAPPPAAATFTLTTTTLARPHLTPTGPLPMPSGTARHSTAQHSTTTAHFVDQLLLGVHCRGNLGDPWCELFQVDPRQGKATTATATAKLEGPVRL